MYLHQYNAYTVFNLCLNYPVKPSRETVIIQTSNLYSLFFVFIDEKYPSKLEKSVLHVLDHLK